jgi:lysophospholipase L1-like esterase
MLRRLLSIAATVFIFSACSNSADTSANNPPIRNAKPGAGSLTVLGDSLAAGYGAKNGAIKPAACIARGLNTTVQDFSVAGLTSSQILAKADQAQASGPKVIFVSSGGNDAILDMNKHGSYPAGKTLSEMSSLFERLLDTGAVVVYLGLNPPFAGGERLPQISQLARGKGVIVVDGMNGFWNNPNLMSDRIHPNDLGYSILCERVLTALKGYYP